MTAPEALRGVPLLRATINHIVEHPDGWDQKVWRSVPLANSGIVEPLPTPCGTSMCLAGEACQIVDPDGWLVNADVMAKIKALAAENADLARALSWEAHSYGEWILATDEDPIDYVTYKTISKDLAEMRGLDNRHEVPVVSASSRASRLFGVRDIGVLFDEHNTLPVLMELVEAVEEGVEGPELRTLAEQLREHHGTDPDDE